MDRPLCKIPVETDSRTSPPHVQDDLIPQENDVFQVSRQFV